MYHQKYALLEDGTIESLYYENNEPRWIEKEGKYYYLIHDRPIIKDNKLVAVALCKNRIIKEADNKEELENEI